MAGEPLENVPSMRDEASRLRATLELDTAPLPELGAPDCLIDMAALEPPNRPSVADEGPEVTPCALLRADAGAADPGPWSGRKASHLRPRAADTSSSSSMAPKRASSGGGRTGRRTAIAVPLRASSERPACSGCTCSPSVSGRSKYMSCLCCNTMATEVQPAGAREADQSH